MRLVKAFNQQGHPALPVIRPAGALMERLGPLSPQVFTVPMRNGWDVLSMQSIKRLIRKTAPPIVQTYMGRATRLTRLPRNSQAVHIARLGGYYKIDGYYRHAHAWVGNTHGLCNYMTHQGLPARRVFHIGNFVDLKPPSPPETLHRLRESLTLPEDALILFSLGRLIDFKGFEDLLDAFALLPPEIGHRPLYLVIAGDGPQRRQLHDRSAALGVSKRVRWPGWQDHPTPYFHLADIFVCPSRHETLGNVILEAWAHHLPVVSTRTPGALELISDEENGLLAPCDAPQALAGRLREMCELKAPARRLLADNGRRKVERFFNPQTIVSAYLDLYESLRRKEI
jgi:glycosyltransferase involved in cell wall biosynthesis